MSVEPPRSKGQSAPVDPDEVATTPPYPRVDTGHDPPRVCIRYFDRYRSISTRWPPLYRYADMASGQQETRYLLWVARRCSRLRACDARLGSRLLWPPHLPAHRSGNARMVAECRLHGGDGPLPVWRNGGRKSAEAIPAFGRGA